MSNAYLPFALMPACAGFGGQAKGGQMIRRRAIVPRAGAARPCNRGGSIHLFIVFSGKEGLVACLIGFIKCSHQEWFGNNPATPPGSVSALWAFYKSVIPPG